jgi:hypothetical protein
MTAINLLEPMVAIYMVMYKKYVVEIGLGKNKKVIQNMKILLQKEAFFL